MMLCSRLFAIGDENNHYNLEEDTTAFCHDTNWWMASLAWIVSAFGAAACFCMAYTLWLLPQLKKARRLTTVAPLGLIVSAMGADDVIRASLCCVYFQVFAVELVMLALSVVMGVGARVGLGGGASTDQQDLDVESLLAQLSPALSSIRDGAVKHLLEQGGGSNSYYGATSLPPAQ